MVSTLDDNLKLLEGLEAAQDLVRRRLRLKRGEWFLDTNAGRRDLATVHPDEWQAEIADAIRGVDCVTDVRNVKIEKNETPARMRCTAIVETTEGTFELSEEFEP